MSQIAAQKDRPGPPRRARQQTQTLKSHRYEPFNKRIAKLKIDPIHKVQQSRLANIVTKDDDLQSSHFRNALDEWSELNLTATFTSFYYRVHTQSESLPQILHHADFIVHALLEHIEKQESLSLEALLSLVAHLAHDLGQQFEQYFLPTVSLVAKVAAAQDDPAVVEACFTCMAWIYKYLSHLLVKDLSPLLDCLLPYFSARKEYIRRFTAESLAFLLRKAAVMYRKDPNPLKHALRHLLVQKLHGIPQNNRDAFAVSCMTLLGEAACGVDAGLHSCLTDLFACLCDIACSYDSEYDLLSNIVSGLSVSLIHKTDAEGCKRLQDAIIALSKSSAPISGQSRLSARLMVVLAATRAGSRVSAWSWLLSELQGKLATEDIVKGDFLTWTQYSKAAAAAMVNAPLNDLLPYSRKLTELLQAKSHNPRVFFSFCEAVARLDKRRFQDLIAPKLQEYVESSWSRDIPALVVVCHDLTEMQCIARDDTVGASLTPDRAMEGHLLELLTDNHPPSLVALLQSLSLQRSIQFPISAHSKLAMRKILVTELERVLGQRTVNDLRDRVALGWGFWTLQDLSVDLEMDLKGLFESFVELPESVFSLLLFVKAMSRLISSPHGSYALTKHCAEQLLPKMSSNLMKTSKELRTASLSVLKHLGGKLGIESWLVSTVESMEEILAVPYTMANARQLAMLLRRLPQMQSSLPQDSPLILLIPSFALGLVQDYHDQLRNDVADVLSQTIQDSKVEAFVLETFQNWLQSPKSLIDFRGEKVASDPMQVSHFECTKLSGLDSSLDDTRARFAAPLEHIETLTENAHDLKFLRLPADARLIALEVLNKMPQVAEKRSKFIVPCFLAANKTQSVHDQIVAVDSSVSEHTLSPDIEQHTWTQKERKLFLQLLGQFNNPRVLYRADDVRAHLFDLLTSGDSSTRLLALTALLKWKDQPLVAHRDTLSDIAEDKKTTSEITILLNPRSDIDNGLDPTRRELLAVLLRLILGQLISRSGSHGSQEAKRKALLRPLFRMQQEEISLFLDIVLGPLRVVSLTDGAHSTEDTFEHDLIKADQQYGFLRMIVSMLDVLQFQFTAHASHVLDAILYCVARSERIISRTGESAPALVKTIRRTGLSCLNQLLQYCEDLDMSPYCTVMWHNLILPRMPDFLTENAQGVSGLLTLFSRLSKSRTCRSILAMANNKVLFACSTSLSSALVKAPVKIFILEHIFTPLFAANVNVDREVLEIGGSTALRGSLMSSLADILKQNPPKELLLSAVLVIQTLAREDIDEADVAPLIGLMLNALRETNQRLAPHIKSQILKALHATLIDHGQRITAQQEQDLLLILAGYLDFFKDLPNRHVCVSLLANICERDQSLHPMIDICRSLNSTGGSDLNVIDLNAQSTAFSTIHGFLDSKPSELALLPVVNNLVFIVRTSEDTASRGNALGCLKHMVKSVGQSAALKDKLTTTTLKVIRRHLGHESETVRADFLELLGTIVQHWRHDHALLELERLTFGHDEEASFFTNILHIQQHRRTRAMRRCVVEIESGALSADVIAEFILPIFQKFVLNDSSTESAQATKGQALASLTSILQWLDWKTFRRVFRQYRQDIEQKEKDQKVDVRLLNQAADALTAACNPEPHRSTTDENPKYCHLQTTLPSMQVVHQELTSSFIPKLAELSHFRDEGEVSERLPAAVVAIKLIRLLPEHEVPQFSTAIVLDMAQILRNRTQEVRDLARRKLTEVVVLLGSSSVQFIVKQLRTVLTRGFQLHVLAYTMHSILLATADTRSLGDLDYCLEDLVKVIFDDTFGVTGQEKENTDYTSDMKEVKGRKSFDSMEILAKSTSVNCLVELVSPFQTLLTGNLTTKQVKHVDELFRRIGVGISHSAAASSQDLLVFAFEMIKSFYKSKVGPKPLIMTNDEKNRDRFLVQKDNTSRVGTVTSTSLQYKSVKFAIDIARSAFARHPELMTPSNVHGFVPVIGDALMEAQEDVKTSAMRLLATIVRLEMPELAEHARLHVIEAVKVVKSATSTNEEAAQAALKVVAAILRDKAEVEVRESDIAYLLKRIAPDLTEPDRQGLSFNFIKAVMARRMQLTELYEIVDNIALMMVTSHSRSGRDVARGVYVHFLLDYAQGKARWSKQVKFLVKNLDYKHPEGRASIMEATNTLMSKVGPDTAAEIASVMFVPTVLRMANDENEQCRQLAGVLLSEIFARSVGQTDINMRQTLRSWLEQEDNITLKKISFQAWSLYLQAKPSIEKDELVFLRSHISQVLGSSLDTNEWEVKFHAIAALRILVSDHITLLINQKQEVLWSAVLELTTTTHIWLQISAFQLLALLLQESFREQQATLPLQFGNGLRFDEARCKQLLRASLKALGQSAKSSTLVETVLPTLLFLGRILAENGVEMQIKAQPGAETNTMAVASDLDDDSSADDERDGDSEDMAAMQHISVTKYILDQSARILRREPRKHSAAALQPRLAITTLLQGLLPHLPMKAIISARASTESLLIPLLHLTSTTTAMPRSVDAMFGEAYQKLIEQCQLVLDVVQAKLGDQEYGKVLTAATRQARIKRQERRSKRAIATVAEPELAARDKRRKFEKKKERRKEISDMHRKHRRRDLGF